MRILKYIPFDTFMICCEAFIDVWEALAKRAAHF